jgi:hypothetical protein
MVSDLKETDLTIGCWRNYFAEMTGTEARPTEFAQAPQILIRLCILTRNSQMREIC